MNPVVAQPMPMRPTRPLGPGRVVWWVIVAALAGACIVLQVSGWGALINETNGACGGHHGPCPQGDLPVTVISLVLGLATVPFTVRGLFRRPRWLALLLVPAMVGGGFFGRQAFDFFHGATLSTTWKAPYDTPDTLTTQGVWLEAGMLIRVRTDQVTAYDAATGAVRWTWSVPGQNVVCTLSRGTAGSIGVLGYAADSAPCSNLVAIDLNTGKQLWSATPDTGDFDDRSSPLADFVAAAGNVVTVRSDTGLTAYDARTGTQQWQTPSASNCPDEFVAADANNVVAISACQQSYLVADLDPASGRARWQTPVAEPAANYQLGLLATDPVVIDDALPGARGTDHLRVFTAQGQQRVTIDASSLTTASGPASLDTGGYAGDAAGAFQSQPIYRTMEFGNTLVAATQQTGDHVDLLGYDLTTGRRIWDTPTPDDVTAIGRSGGSAVVIDDALPSPEVLSISAVTGASTEIGVLPGWTFGGDDTGLYPIGAQYLVVSGVGANPTPPVFAFGQ
jgi:outer membrane protein assembly factor BamB